VDARNTEHVEEAGRALSPPASGVSHLPVPRLRSAIGHPATDAWLFLLEHVPDDDAVIAYGRSRNDWLGWTKRLANDSRWRSYGYERDSLGRLRRAVRHLEKIGLVEDFHDATTGAHGALVRGAAFYRDSSSHQIAVIPTRIASWVDERTRTKSAEAAARYQRSQTRKRLTVIRGGAA